MMKLLKPPKLLWYWFILLCVKPIYVRIFKIHAVGLENLPKKGPYLLVGNHSHKLDPFFIGAMIGRPIFQMASDEFFRIPIMRRFMWAMGAFPRKKGTPDLRAIIYARKRIKAGFPLAIYPEGGRNWDGETLPILQSTARLVKMLSVSLVTVVSKGNYLAFPRWADKMRRGPITIYYSKPVTFDAKSTDDEINDYIKKGIYNNDNYTRIDKIRGKNPAKGLTRLLWRCPECRKLESLVEKDGTTLSCSNCSRVWEVNLHCHMREKGHTWRPIKEYADQMFRKEEITPLENDFERYLERDERVYLQSGTISLYNQPCYPKLKKIDDGNLILTEKGLTFIKKSDGNALRYRFENIRGKSTEKNMIFQIVIDASIARFEMVNESCYKWEIFYDYIRKERGFLEEN
jgi:1-acyl-sn-glycerol-3-phosphate acyltransferase